jgi:hypothetical protein
VDAAHQACPYSKLTRGNRDDEIDLILDGPVVLPGVYRANRLEQNAMH